MSLENDSFSIVIEKDYDPNISFFVDFGNGKNNISHHAVLSREDCASLELLGFFRSLNQNINAVNADGLTALDLAFEQGDSDLYAYIRSCGGKHNKYIYENSIIILHNYL